MLAFSSHTWILWVRENPNLTWMKTRVTRASPILGNLHSWESGCENGDRRPQSGERYVDVMLAISMFFFFLTGY